MNRNLLQTVLRQAEAFAAPGDVADDADLLARFSTTKDEAAFAELVRRHGPMVWSVCRQLLPNPADAEDAFQATFLALVRSAKSVRSAAALGAWLHGVAVRVAAKVKRSAVRRRQRETKVARNEALGPQSQGFAWADLLAAVHEEVRQLPDALRTAFVLCDLEGVRQPDAAARLGWKLGTLSGRLTKARQQLLDRLARRGIAAASAAALVGLGAAVAGAAVPSELVGKLMALVAAPATVPSALLNLAVEVSPVWNKTKLLAAALLVAGGLSFGVGAGLLSNADAQSGAGGPPAPPPPPGAGRGDPGARGGERGRGEPPAPPGAPGTPGRPGQPPGAGGGDRDRGGGGGFGGFGGGSGGVGGGIASGPVTRPWDYKFEALPGSTDELHRLVSKLGDEGWEFAGQVTVGRSSELVFKRPKFPGGGMGAMGGMGPAGMPGFGGGRGGDPMGGGFGGGGGGVGGGPGRAGGGAPGGLPDGGGVPGRGGPGAGTGPGGTGGPGGGRLPPPQGGGEPKLIALKNAQAADMASILTEVFGNRGGVRIVSDIRTNTIIVSAQPGDLALIEKLADALDRPEANPRRGGGGGREE
jgi:RNA polymerase sigma factor (sigma-70 family)